MDITSTLLSIFSCRTSFRLEIFSGLSRLYISSRFIGFLLGLCSCIAQFGSDSCFIGLLFCFLSTPSHLCDTVTQSGLGLLFVILNLFLLTHLLNIFLVLWSDWGTLHFYFFIWSTLSGDWCWVSALVVCWWGFIIWNLIDSAFKGLSVMSRSLSCISGRHAFLI